jgi:hypothetical protein
MDTEQHKIQQSNWEILYGGRDIDVQVIDLAAQQVRTETVKVRKLPISEMAKLADAYAGGAPEAALYLGRNVAFVESLVTDSGFAVLTEGRRLNEKSFAAWLQLQKQAAETLTGRKLDLEAALREAAQATKSA